MAGCELFQFCEHASTQGTGFERRPRSPPHRAKHALNSTDSWVRGWCRVVECICFIPCTSLLELVIAPRVTLTSKEAATSNVSTLANIVIVQRGLLANKQAASSCGSPLCDNLDHAACQTFCKCGLVWITLTQPEKDSPLVLEEKIVYVVEKGFFASTRCIYIELRKPFVRNNAHKGFTQGRPTRAHLHMNVCAYMFSPLRVTMLASVLTLLVVARSPLRAACKVKK